MDTVEFFHFNMLHFYRLLFDITMLCCDVSNIEMLSQRSGLTSGHTLPPGPAVTRPGQPKYTSAERETNSPGASCYFCCISPGLSSGLIFRI